MMLESNAFIIDSQAKQTWAKEKLGKQIPGLSGFKVV